MKLSTPLTKLLKIEKPIILAGMNVAAGPDLAAAVSNHGGLGVIGGVSYTPKFLKAQLDKLKSQLRSPDLPFGVDLLLPKVGAGARATNYDYTEGQLPKLIDIIIESGASLFVSAVGVPPSWAVEKLHAANILVANMVGAPKHVKKALAANVDLIIAQGGEGGGHTGDVATSILIPKCVDLVAGHLSPLTKEQILVVAAGGIFDGRGLAMALSLGATGVWVGTRFVASAEAGAPPRHQKAVCQADFHDTIRTTIYTGRPMRVLKTNYILNWEQERPQEIRTLLAKGVIPIRKEIEDAEKNGTQVSVERMMEIRPLLMGQAAGAISHVQPAREIMDEMIQTAILTLKNCNSFIIQSKL